MGTIKKVIKRAEDLNPEEVERIRRDLTKNATVVKHQKSEKELKILRKQGLEPKPRGVVVKGPNKINFGMGIGHKYR